MSSQLESKTISNELTIRNATKDDIEEMNVICNLVFHGCIPSYKDSTDYFIAILNDKVVAFGYRCGEIREYEKDMYIACMDYKLEDFCVHPDYRRQGIGTLLVKAMYDSILYYKGYARIEFWITADSHVFWRNATRDMYARMQEICKDCDCDRDCKQCARVIGYELDIYNSYMFMNADDCSHFCSMVKYNATSIHK